MLVCNICKEKITGTHLKLNCVAFGGLESEQEEVSDKVNIALKDVHFHIDCFTRMIDSGFTYQQESEPKQDSGSETKKAAVKESGSGKRRSRSYKYDWDKAEQLYANGVSIAGIADKIGSNYTRVWRYFNKQKQKDDRCPKSDSTDYAVYLSAAEKDTEQPIVEEDVKSFSMSCPESKPEDVTSDRVDTASEVTVEVTEVKKDDSVVATDTDVSVVSDADASFKNNTEHESNSSDTFEEPSEKPAVDISNVSAEEFAELISGFKDPKTEIRKYFPKRPGGNARVDVGKLFALRKAGWSIYNIGRELHIDAEMVNDILHDQRFRSAFLDGVFS